MSRLVDAGGPGASAHTSNVGEAGARPRLPRLGAALSQAPVGRCLLVGMGGLFLGVTGPLLSAFIPPMVRDALGNERTAIGFVMAIDNVLLLLLVPWSGAASDRACARGRGRLPIVIAGLVLAAAGMAVFPSSARLGIAGMAGAMVVLYGGINLQRSPFQALVADFVPSRYRSLGSGSFTFQMCVGAVVFLALGRTLGLRTAFFMAAGAILAIAVALRIGLRESTVVSSADGHTTYRSLLDAGWSAVSGRIPGMRAIFIATFLLQLTFQTFTTWYALHAIDRFGMTPEDAALGFIAWAMGGVVGALPAGVIGVRIGRRNAMLVGFALMGLSLVTLDRVNDPWLAIAFIGLVSAAWTLPNVNAYPLFVEPIPRASRGALAALFLLSMAFGGAIGDPLNGALFDLAGAYRPMFLMMAVYTALAFVVVLFVPRGAGEAETGSDEANTPPALA
jgi:MFS family permease